MYNVPIDRQLLVQSDEGIYRGSPSGSAQVASENSNVVHVVVMKGVDTIPNQGSKTWPFL